MAKNKYDFIKEILESKKMTTAQRERVLLLAKDEIEKDGVKGKDLEVRLLKIEELLNSSPVKVENEIEIHFSDSNKEKTRNFLHRPKETYELLSFFSSTDGGVKNLTHSFNYGYIKYEDLMIKCKEEFETGKRKYPNVPNPLLTRIEEFAFSENPEWYIMRGHNKIEKKTGWSEPAFVKWYKENKTHPANDAFYNSEMIIPFKETIQVRSDLGNLKRLLDELSIIVFQNSIKLNIKETITSAQFYTDVDRLGLAIFHIFSGIKQASLINFSDEVEINFEIKEGVKILELIHIGSKPTKNVNDFDFLGGDLGSAKNYLWGLCNYDILAEFKEGKYRKVILSDKRGETEKNETTGKWIGKNYPSENTDIKGFTHVLKFY